MNIKELADIGARAVDSMGGNHIAMDHHSSYYEGERHYREAFAQAVIDAYCKDDDMLKKRVHELMAEKGSLAIQVAANNNYKALYLNTVVHLGEKDAKIEELNGEVRELQRLLQKDKERAEFESWAKARGLALEIRNGEYEDGTTVEAYEA